MELDLRLTINMDGLAADTWMEAEALQRYAEDAIIHAIVSDTPFVTGAVVLRNNGFSHLLPDESTRQER